LSSVRPGFDCDAAARARVSFPTRRSSISVGRVVTTADDKARALVGEGTYPGLSPEPAPEESSEQASDGRHRDGTHYLRLAPVPSDRKSTRLNSSHVKSSYAVFCLHKKDRQ